MNVSVLDHPLINHYMTIIRNKNTSSSEFKTLAKKVLKIEHKLYQAAIEKIFNNSSL